MRVRSLIIALVIVLSPFIVGVVLFLTRSSGRIPVKAHLVTDTRENNKGISYKGIKIDWTFYPDWEYKPLFVSSDKYLVFMFHYTNNTDYDVVLMPSYTFSAPDSRRYSANEEIAMYIEDGLENRLKANDETPITFKVKPKATKHYIVTFERPKRLEQFSVDVDVFRDVTLRIFYKKENGIWVNCKNALIKKYKGRG